MDSSLFHPTSMASTGRSLRLPWITASLVVLALGLSACDRRSESNPGSTPAAIGSGEKSRGRGEAGTPSDSVEVRTPTAPDTLGGGSSGPKGSVPTPDTSGGPSSASSAPGAAPAGTASTPSSTPQGSTGNTSR